jgi:hypothetical protein
MYRLRLQGRCRFHRRSKRLDQDPCGTRARLLSRGQQMSVIEIFPDRRLAPPLVCRLGGGGPVRTFRPWSSAAAIKRHPAVVDPLLVGCLVG